MNSENTRLIPRSPQPSTSSAVENNSSSLEGKKPYQHVAATAASLAAFGVGNSLAWSFPGLTHFTRHKEIHNNGSFENCMMPSQPLNTHQAVWVLLLLELGAIFGAIISGWCINYICRKWMIIVANIIGILSWLFIIFGFNNRLIYAGRFLSGFAVGSISIAVPIFLREITDESKRESIGSCFEAMLCLGIMFYYIFEVFMSCLWLNVLLAVIPFFSLLTMIFLLETPKCEFIRVKINNIEDTNGTEMTYTKGTENTEKDSLLYQEDDYETDTRRITLPLVLQEKTGGETSISPIRQFMPSTRFTSLCVCFGIMLVRQICSIYLMVLFRENQEIYQSTAGETWNVCLSVIGVIQTVGTFLSLLIVGKTSKKSQLILYVVTIITNFASSQYFDFAISDSKKVSNAVTTPADITTETLDVLLVNLLLVSSTLGWGPIPWLVMGDLFHPSFEGTTTVPLILLIIVILIFFSIVYTYYILAVGIVRGFWFSVMFASFALSFIYFLVTDTIKNPFSFFTSWLNRKYSSN